MDDIMMFLAVMAALSAAVQTFIEYALKQGVLRKWLDGRRENEGEERNRHIRIHAIALIVGAGLAWSVGLEPLAYLGVQAAALTNAVAAGFLVSFGGSFFDETVGAVRQFKKAQESVAKARDEAEKARATSRAIETERQPA